MRGRGSPDCAQQSCLFDLETRVHGLIGGRISPALFVDSSDMKAICLAALAALLCVSATGPPDQKIVVGNADTPHGPPRRRAESLSGILGPTLGDTRNKQEHISDPPLTGKSAATPSSSATAAEPSTGVPHASMTSAAEKHGTSRRLKAGRRSLVWLSLVTAAVCVALAPWSDSTPLVHEYALAALQVGPNSLLKTQVKRS